MSDSIKQTLDELEAIAELAKANFPRSTSVRIEVSSPSRTSASTTIPYYLLKDILKRCRTALNKEGRDA